MSLTVEQAQELVDAVYDYTDYYGEIEVRESYSGRGMYGDSVVAFVATDITALAALHYVAGYLDGMIDGCEGQDVPVYGKDVPTRTDSMGLGVVIY